MDSLAPFLHRVFDSESCELVDFVPRPMPVGQSLLSELCARHLGAKVGVFRADIKRRSRITGDIEALDVLIKIKPADTVLISAGTNLALQCDPDLGRLCPIYSPMRELGRSHLREIALYRAPPPGLARHMPHVHGLIADTKQGLWISVLEYLGEAEFLADMNATERWTLAHFEAAVDALAGIHAEYFDNDARLLAEPWIALNAEGNRVLAMREWWEALARYAERNYDDPSLISLATVHEQLVRDIDKWWPSLCSLPRTLIHNDFNPRNLAFRRGPQGPVLCAFDWELATLGVPQHDLAELLIFALPSSADQAWVARLIQRHHDRLAEQVGTRWSAAEWQRGFALSLDHLLVDRLSMYALPHAFRPLPYLPRILKNWVRLHAWAG
ncbi:MAG: aminoglycoside phosphotransferase family protein [Burkholderiales bacterium]